MLFNINVAALAALALAMSAYAAPSFSHPNTAALAATTGTPVARSLARRDVDGRVNGPTEHGGPSAEGHQSGHPGFPEQPSNIKPRENDASDVADVKRARNALAAN